MRALLIVFIAACAAPADEASMTYPIPIIVILGQSNAGPHGAVQSLPNFAQLGYDQPFPAVQWMQKYEDTPTDPIVWGVDTGPTPIALQPTPGGNDGMMGVELSLGRRLVDLGRNVALARMAIGSTYLGLHWLAVGSTFPSTPPVLFDQLVAFCKQVEIAIGGKIAGFVHIAGEADAGNGGFAAAYDVNQIALVNQLRVTWPRSWYIFNLLNINFGSLVTTIRAKQLNAAAALARTMVLNFDDLPLTGAHYDSPGFYTMGFRFAEAAHTLMVNWPAAGDGPNWF